MLELHEIVVRNIIEFLGDARMKRKDLAEAMSVTEATVSRWLSSKPDKQSHISINDLPRIAKALAVDVGELIGGRGFGKEGASDRAVIQTVADRFGYDVTLRKRRVP